MTTSRPLAVLLALTISTAASSSAFAQNTVAPGDARPGTAQVDNDRDDDGFDMGWLGLLGLAGLAGLRGRRDDRLDTRPMR